MASQQSYVYDPKSDCERARTRAREKQTRTQRATALEGVDFTGIERVLDVGCGTGVVGFDLLKLIPAARLVGADIEPSILRVARGNIPSGRSGDLVTGDVFRLPLRGASFDLVACQYVLQHLRQPVKALEEMRRVCRPGGQAIIFEFDDRTGFTYPPPPPELQALFQAKIDLIERRGGDRSIGRKLYHLMSSAGWTGIDVRIVPDVWLGPAERKSVLDSAYLSFTQLKPKLLAEGLISEPVLQAGLYQLYDFYQGDVFSVVFFFAAFARKPTAAEEA